MSNFLEVSHMIRAGRVSQSIIDLVIEGDHSPLESHKVLKAAVEKYGKEKVMEAVQMRSTKAIKEFEDFNCALDILSSMTEENDAEIISESIEEYEQKLAALADLDKQYKIKQIHKALAIINGVRICKDLGIEENNVIAEMIMYSLIENVSFWKNRKKADAKARSYGKIIVDCIKEILGEDSPIVTQTVDSYNYIKDLFTIDEAEKDNKHFISKPNDLITIYVNSNGITLKLLDNTEVAVKNGYNFRFQKELVYDFGTNVFNKKLLTVLKNVNIHQEIELADYDIFAANPVKRYDPKPIMFGNNILAKLLILRENNIDLTRLYEDKNEEKIMVLGRNRDNTITAIPVPGHNYQERYLNFISLSLNDAKKGIVTPLKTLPRMLQLDTTLKETSIFSRENINKIISRIDKLYEKDGWETKKIKLLIVNDATSENLFPWLGTGAIYMPDWWLNKYGVCRVITDMDHGGIKAVTARTKSLDYSLGLQDFAVVGPAAFKGGLLSAAGLCFGNYDFLPNGLMSLVETKSENINILKLMKAYDLASKEYEIRGEKVKGIVVEIPVTITNAYTVESVEEVKHDEEEEKTNTDLMLDRVNKTIDKMENNLQSGLRNRIMELAVTEESFSVSTWLDYGLAEGSLKFKKPVTRVVSSEIQSVAHWYGKQTAINWLDSLASNKLNVDNQSKDYASDMIMGIKSHKVIGKHKALDVLSILTEGLKKQGHQLRHDSNVYPTPILKDIVKLFGDHDTCGWVELEYPCGSKVHVPTGYHLLNDFDPNSQATYTVAKGLLAELLKNLKSMMININTFYPDLTKNPKLWNAVLQVKFFGKELGYQHTTGFYGVMLPMPELDRGYELALTRRSRFVKTSERKIRVNSRKHPTLFHGSVAGFDCYGDNFFTEMSESMKDLFACVVFTHPDTILVLQDDTDGDSRSVSFNEFGLPLFKGPSKEFNGQFFTNFVQGEQEGCYLKLKASKRYSVKEVQLEINKAVAAKDMVGQFTATKYYYEAMINNVAQFTGFDEEEYKLTTKDRKDLIAFLSMLIQLEAMDNIKQEGSEDFISNLIKPYSMKKPFKGRKTEQQAITDHLLRVKTLVIDLLTKYNVVDGEEFASKLVMTLYHIAVTYDPNSIVSFNIMNNNRVRKNNFNDIMLDEEATGNFNYFNSYNAIVNGVDQNSMYREIILATIRNRTSL